MTDDARSHTAAAETAIEIGEAAIADPTLDDAGRAAVARAALSSARKHLAAASPSPEPATGRVEPST